MIEYSQSNSLTEAYQSLQLLRSLENYYPGFEYWYVNQAMPGIITGKDVMIVARENKKIVGVALGKNTLNEKKLRCVRVIPELQQKGIGIHLIEKTLKAINTDKPGCTVSEEMFHEFSRPLINMFDFSLDKVEKNLYRKGKLEYIFNQQIIKGKNYD
jgi:hypothetical protein